MCNSVVPYRRHYNTYEIEREGEKRLEGGGWRGESQEVLLLAMLMIVRSELVNFF